MSSARPPFADKLAEIRRRIERAATLARRPPGDVALIAVSKTVAEDGLIPALEAGQTEFGENRVQEALSKWPAIKERFPNVRLHLIGPLQSNKAREAVRLFDAVHSLDRESLAGALASEMAKSGARLELFVQVNTGLEAQKSGVAPKETEAFVAKLRGSFGLAVHGLMCIPPESHAPAPHFAMLRQLSHDCGLPLLSMGMSGDYEIAVQLGATHVRVGSALFGARQVSSST